MSAPKYQKPTKMEESYMGVSYEHPAYGTMIVSKTQGGADWLFGSDVEHSAVFHIEIRQAYEQIGTGTRYVMAKERIVSFDMTAAQFAEMVGSVGVGSGVPITLRYAPKITEKLERKPLIEIDESLEDKLKNKAKKLAREGLAAINKSIENLESLLDSKTISRKEFKSCLDSLCAHVQNLPANLEFAITIANEQIEENITSAKSEIELYANVKRREVENIVSGLATLVNDSKTLSDKAISYDPNNMVVKLLDDKK